MKHYDLIAFKILDALNKRISKANMQKVVKILEQEDEIEKWEMVINKLYNLQNENIGIDNSL